MKIFFKSLGLGAVIVVGCLLLAIYIAGTGRLGNFDPVTKPTGPAVDHAIIQQRQQLPASTLTLGDKANTEILFGDLHVHTTYSFDAFTLSLPTTNGNVGSHPPADACDFARYCSALDFWSINDHAEQITPRIWSETIDAIRACNDVTDSSNPDLVAFLGWEWTQTGQTPETHFGHKNVVLRDLGDDTIPIRPIAAPVQGMPIPGTMVRGAMALLANDQRTRDLMKYTQDLEQTPRCELNGSVRDRTTNCIEIAEDPNMLFDKLDQWGMEAMVIPHGTTWGIYSPPGTDWRKQLASYRGAKYQNLIEIMSGHGNSERYIDNQAYNIDANGNRVCPAETPSYLPACQQAGSIIQQRCEAAGEPATVCEQRAADARQNYVDAGRAGHLTVPGVDMWTQWRDSGQCRDCFLPTFNYRRRGAAQYILAMTDFSEPQNPQRFNLGFIAASDNHGARPGTGYKQLDIKRNSDINGLIPVLTAGNTRSAEQAAESIKINLADANSQRLAEAERFNSFWYTGGLVAVHAPARDRHAIWGALQRKAVYATSGPRIKLWFDVLSDAGEAPMGSTVETANNPTLRVRALGSFEQKPGCPTYATAALGEQRLGQLCGNECYNPSNEVRPITRLEIVRIRPQQYPNEPLDSLIEDPWRSYNCPAGNRGCEFTIEDDEFSGAGRDAIYYARAIEAPIPTMNADTLGCEYNEQGVCIRMRDCGNNPSDDCLAPAEHRAWSSPIFINAK